MDQQRGRFAVVAALAAAVILCTSALAQPSRFRLETVSAWGGAVNAFQRVGNTGYCGSGQRLVILDMTNEGAIQEIGSVNLEGTVQDLLCRDNFVYVALEAPLPFPLAAVDVSVPSAPRVTWTANWANPPAATAPRRLRLYGTLLYAIDTGGNGVYAYSLVDPAVPAAVPTFPPPANYYRVEFPNPGWSSMAVDDMQIIGSTAYVANQNGFLVTYDLADPLHPAYMGRLLIRQQPGQGVTSISVSNGRALVQAQDSTRPCGHTSFARMVDVSDPFNPTPLGVPYDNFFFADRSVMVGNYALVADSAAPGDCYVEMMCQSCGSEKGLAIIDFTNPFAPSLVATYKRHSSSIRDVRVQGDRAYLFCDGQGLVVIDISTPPQPMSVGGYYSPAILQDCAKEGNLLYVSDTWNGFTILDVSDPSATPTVRAVYRTAEHDPGPLHQDHRNIVVRDNVAYLAGGFSGAHIVDLSTPTSPTLISTILPPVDDHFRVWCVALSGTFLHASVSTHCVIDAPPDRRQLRLYDISNLTMPVEVGRTNAPWVGNAMAVKGGVTLLGRAMDGIDFGYLDSFSAAPAHITATPCGGRDLALEGNILLTAKQNSPNAGMHIMDVADPLHPQERGFVAGDHAYAVAIQGSRAFFSNDWPAIRVFDIATPTAPQLLAYSAGPAPLKIRVDGEFLYTTAGLFDRSRNRGMVIKRFSCYANCDGSTTLPVLTIADFGCFLNKFASGDSYANCDGSTAQPVLTIADFGCFLNGFAAGCN